MSIRQRLVVFSIGVAACASGPAQKVEADGDSQPQRTAGPHPEGRVAPPQAAAIEPLPDPDIESFLAQPWQRFERDKVITGFRIIVLSNLAAYCANLHFGERAPSPTAEHCLSRLADLALDRRISPYGSASLLRVPLGDYGLYLSHLNTVLGIRELVVHDRRHAALHRRISQHLARRSLSDAHRMMPSYPNVAARWPADQAVTLYSLYLYDRVTGESLSREPLAAYQAYIDEHGTDSALQLPRSELAGVTKTSGYPRGCALSYTIYYLQAFAPEQALAMWERYKSAYLIGAVFAAAFREWPPGVDLPGDVDSGPIVMGAGAAATGLALAASRAVGDESTYDRLKRSQRLVQLGGGAALKRIGASILSRSIALRGDTYVSWTTAAQ